MEPTEFGDELREAHETANRDRLKRLTPRRHAIVQRLVDTAKADAASTGRERDPQTPDRRAVAVGALPDRAPELFRLYGGMNSSLDRICADYTDAELELITDFLKRTLIAARAATDELDNS